MRNHRKEILFDDDEWERVKEKAYIAEMNLTQYIRKMALGGIVKKYDMESVNDLTTAINRVGNNLNQIANVINETHSVYEKDMEQIKKLWKRYVVIVNNMIYEELKSEELK